MKTIWITGARGFIGRHLARFLADLGHVVIGLGYGPWPEEAARKWGLSYWLNGEVNAPNLRQLLAEGDKPTVVYHLAGGSIVGSSFISPLEDYRRTVDSSARLLDWIRMESPKSKLIFSSSAAVYGAGHSAKIDEETPISPYSPYGFHKAMMEMLCMSYAENFGLKIAVVRLFSVYGAGLEKQLIWDICSKLATGQTTLSFGGTGREKRDWLHVSDAVRLLWLIKSQCSDKCPVINGGTGVETNVHEIVTSVCSSWGSDAVPVFNGQPRKGDPKILLADIGKANSLGFMPEKTLLEGIKEVIRWIKTQPEN